MASERAEEAEKAMMRRFLYGACRQIGQSTLLISPFTTRRRVASTGPTVRWASGSQTVPTSRAVGARRGALGQVLVLVAIAIVVLMAFPALAIDVGQFWSVRRHMQTAADAGAIAGAIALRLNRNPTVAADNVTSTNGFTDGSQGITVAVNNPPTSGQYAGDSTYVEVVVSQPQPTFFMRVLGYDTVTVSARSVASSVNGPACVYALDPTDSGSLTVGGSSTVTLSCGAIVDSNNATALNSNGGATMTATNIGVVGGYSGSGFTPTPVTGLAPAPDPLSYLQPPTVGACDCTNLHVGTSGGKASCALQDPSNPNNLYPGVYCGGIQISGNNPVHFNPGVYILDGGGMKITATNANLSGTEVMFYNTGTASSYGGISLSGSNTVNLSAPTSGPYEGILFFQDRSIPVGDAGSTITGSSGSTFDGAIYFPTTAVTYAGSSSSNGYTIVVGYTVSISGNAVLGDNYSMNQDGSPIRATALYE
jgi:Putative Flp pilus-assembly TadE/G-like